MAHMRVSSYDAQNYHLQKNALSSSLRASNHKKNSIVSTSHQGPPQLIGAGANIGNAHHVIPITGIHHKEMLMRPGTNASTFTTESLGMSHRTIMSNANHSKLLVPAGGTAGLVSSRKQGSVTSNNLVRISTSPAQGRSQ